MDDSVIFTRNWEVLEFRWPQIAQYINALQGDLDVTLVDNMPEKTVIYKGHHLSSCYDRTHEARIQNSAIPLTAVVAHLYGAGLGDAAYDLLQREQLDHLEVYILSPMVFYAYLALFDATPWLNDTRVQLHLSHEQRLNSPYSVNVGELFFAEDAALSVKNLIEIDRNKRNMKRFHQMDLALLYQNNRAKNQLFLDADSFIADLKNSGAKKKYVLVGGGPTASEQCPWLKQRRDEFVILAASTALIPLEQEGIIPDYVLAIDAAEGVAQHFALQHAQNYQDSTLVYCPVTNHEAVTLWSGKRRICLLESNPVMQDLVKQQPQSVLYSGGSVAHTAAALAVLLGATEVVMVGYDFCFAYGKSHLKNNPLGEEVDMNAAVSWVINGHGKRVPSSLNLVTYKDAMEEYIAANPHVKFYNTGREGAAIRGAEWI